jgi:POT family proton-dependent oligopeptide transporter
MLFSPPLAWLYARLARGPGDLPLGLKFALGFAAVGAGFAVFAASGLAAVDGRVSAWFVVAGYALIALGELLISGLGLAVIARYVPERLSGFLMGVYFAVVGVAMYLGGMVANLARVPVGSQLSAEQTLPLYLGLFVRLSLAGLIGFALSLAMLVALRRVAARAPAA